MAAIELLLSQARRHCFSKTQPQLSLLLLSRSSTNPPCPAILHRSLCSISSPPSSEPKPEQPNPETRPNQSSGRRQPISIQPISYAVKRQDTSGSSSEEDPSRLIQSPQPPQRPWGANTDHPRPANDEVRTWTREDFRYVKDTPSISQVSYPTRVAPLPEYSVEGKKEGEGVEKAGEERKEQGNVELERERRRIEVDGRLTRRVFKVEEDKAPFPTLIKVENKKQEKVIYDLKEAIHLVKASAKEKPRKFDETIEAHVNLASELSRSDLKLDGFVSLPHGSGKVFRVAIFAEGAAAEEARAAGAAVVGGQEFIDGIKNGSVPVNFDICIATPEMMPRVSQISRKLQRLTPNARNGTVTNDISKAMRMGKQDVRFKKERSERNKKGAIVHVGLGKLNFPDEALHENIGAFVNALLLAKPAGLKKSSKYAGYVKSFYICSTMGPSFCISIQSLSRAADHYNRLYLS